MIAFDGSTSSDADTGDVLAYAWDFGDGASGAGAVVSHTHTQAGIVKIILTVTDSAGATSTY